MLVTRDRAKIEKRDDRKQENIICCPPQTEQQLYHREEKEQRIAREPAGSLGEGQRRQSRTVKNSHKNVGIGKGQNSV